MKYIKVGWGRTKRQLRKMVKLESGRGFTTEPNGYEFADIEVYIDVDALIRRIGHKAMGSKKGVSKLQGGAVMVQATNRQRFTE